MLRLLVLTMFRMAVFLRQITYDPAFSNSLSITRMNQPLINDSMSSSPTPVTERCPGWGRVLLSDTGVELCSDTRGRSSSALMGGHPGYRALTTGGWNSGGSFSHSMVFSPTIRLTPDVWGFLHTSTSSPNLHPPTRNPKIQLNCHTYNLGLVSDPTC